MDVMINTECPCHCKHCFATSFAPSKNSSKKKLSTEELTSALREAVSNGVFHFSLQGGEPFLHPHLKQIIKACEPDKSYITIVSNGTVADKKMLKKVYDLGVDKIAVSIDSYYPEEHDKFRGLKFAHKRAMETIRMAREVGLDVSIAITVLNENIHTDSIQKLFDYAIKNNINVEINIPQPIGNWDGKIDLLLKDKNIVYLEKLHKEHVNIRRDLYYHFGGSGCPAVKETLYLNIYGDIFPCVFMQISIGNIRDHYLKDIRKNALSLHEFSVYGKKCLAGENKEFIRKYISEGFGVPKPADGFAIFGLQPLKKRTEK
jgi:MoaA/NifB/PqqE/SkfB family radical SAM enzyme